VNIATLPKPSSISRSKSSTSSRHFRVDVESGSTDPVLCLNPAAPVAASRGGEFSFAEIAIKLRIFQMPRAGKVIPEAQGIGGARGLVIPVIGQDGNAP
jgi:hypothetical protein